MGWLAAYYLDSTPAGPLARAPDLHTPETRLRTYARVVADLVVTTSMYVVYVEIDGSDFLMVTGWMMLCVIVG